MVSTKAEAEALSMEELTTELTSRGLPTEGLKQPAMLEALLKHLETAATNGTAEAPAAEKATETAAEEPKKDDAATPAEALAAESTAEKTEEAPATTEEAAAALASDATVTPAATEEAVVTTRTVDEVSGGTEEPDAKKAKADAPEAAAEPAKVVETATKVSESVTEAPASEPAAATAE